MARLTICRGISGSGKSTWAESQAGHPVIVSRDRIRMAVFGTEDFIDENLITKIEHSAIEQGLKAGRDVISDNTNIHFKYVKAIAMIGYRQRAEVQVKVFDVSLADALIRNNARASRGGRFVPTDVVRKQHERFQHSKKHTLDLPPLPALYHGTPGKPKAFLVDVDGTLAHMNGKRGPFEWHNVGKDDVDEVVAKVVSALYINDLYDWTPIIMSGRDESSRAETAKWLDLNGIAWDRMFMRPEGDMRPDNIVKAELFDTHVRDNFDVQFVIDDRWQVCEMWLQIGLKVFNVSGLDRGEF